MTTIPDISNLIDLHDQIIERVGGGRGLRSPDLLASARGRVAQASCLDESLDAPALAALYALAVVKNHAFVDGNKRAAYGALISTLSLNGWRLIASPEDTTAMIIRAAAGDVGQDELAAWLRGAAREDETYELLHRHDMAG